MEIKFHNSTLKTIRTCDVIKLIKVKVILKLLKTEKLLHVFAGSLFNTAGKLQQNNNDVD